jgi:hypothetical protein
MKAKSLAAEVGKAALKAEPPGRKEELSPVTVTGERAFAPPPCRALSAA